MTGSAQIGGPWLAAFREGMAELRWVEGHDYVLTQGALINSHRQEIVDRIFLSNLPAVLPFSEIVEEGGLMSYAPSFRDNYRRAAGYVDKIFKGAKPGELPIEQPTKFEFAVNMKTARAMGIAIPQSVLSQADRVIE